ncbi:MULTISPECIES: 30S ribosomal protein S6 [Erysipelotrichaceae]|jgi:small subunit ribosomal protein S6|uniref:30S ribosomal protein S6 n=1 Tax=Erysipelotrichaceae TaxID=128827 RepID=UPI000CF94BFC|nr:MULTISPECIES: 30S ribosomal protein S6 [Erysipelotrichaceae]MCI6745732.1 30S ribosomal protein S6 [Anaerolactibacter massiliensis]MDD5882176.1 30S ribosomal protein S6 [Stecheria intestinalis]MDD7680528.1 30S ribosomal protein S6 [Stecheria intestinalis]MDY4681651.1 30S ribosomal protein S6 [Lachnospiraceae bacterium]
MSKYEVMYIINAGVEDDKRAALIESLNGIITREGGKVVNVNEWGMRDFAYRIDDMTKGYYVVVNFEADNAGVKEFDRLMRINPNVVRFLIVNMDEVKENKPAAKEAK